MGFRQGFATALGALAALALVGAGLSYAFRRSFEPAPEQTPPAPAELAPAPAGGARSVAADYVVHAATFDGDRLDACESAAIAPKPGQESAAFGVIAKIRAAAGETLITRSCAEQFAGRPALAICVVDKEAPIGNLLTTSAYYDVKTAVDSDAYMRDCLAGGGDWRPNPDAAVLESARRRDKLRQLENIANTR